MPKRSVSDPEEAYDLRDEELQQVYTWVDSLTLSRPKRNIHRDFSDGVLMAEIVKAHFPRIVETHNYPAVNSVTQKKRNWNTMVTKVFKKRLGMTLTSQRIDDLANARQYAIEKTLLETREALMRKRESMQAAPAERQPARNRNRMGAGRGAMAGNGGGVGASGAGMGMMADGDMMGIGGQQGQQVQQQMRMMQQQAAAAQQQQQFMQMQQQMAAQQQMQMAMPGHSQSMGMIPHSIAQSSEVDRSILMQKEEKIQELRKVKEILELKIKKLEQLVNLKDSKIIALQQKLADVGVGR